MTDAVDAATMADAAPDAEPAAEFDVAQIEQQIAEAREKEQTARLAYEKEREEAKRFRVVVSRDALEAVLKAAIKAAPSKPSLPVLSCFRLVVKDGEFTIGATNLEIGVVLRVPMLDTPAAGDEGATTLPARKLLDFVAALNKGDTVTLTQLSRHSASIEGARSRTKAILSGMAIEEYPAIPASREALRGWDATTQETLRTQPFGPPPLALPEVAFFFPVDHLRRMWKLVGFAAAEDDARPVFTGMNLRVIDGARVEVCAADSFRLSIYGFDAEGLPSAEDWKRDVLIPAASWKTLAQIAPKGGAVEVVLAANRHQALFLADGFAFLTNTIAGMFPNYDAIVPKATTTTVIVSRVALASSLKRAMMFARDTGNVTDWKVLPNEMRITGRDDDEGSVEQAMDATATYDATVFEDKPAGCDWDPAAGKLAVFLNGRYPQQFVDAVETPCVRMSMKDGQSPVLFEPLPTQCETLTYRLRYLTMPMHSTR